MSQTQQKPFFDGRESAHEYSGPGRDATDPDDLTEVRIGYFGPSDPDHPLHGEAWLAALMAVDELNAGGGYRGLPFRLLPAWSENPWGTGVAEVARMAYTEGIVALIGGVDGATAHLSGQVVAKARFPLVNPGSADRTANMAHLPWIFSCLPGEDLQMEALVAAMEEAAVIDAVVLVSATDHDSRAATAEFVEALARRKRAPRFHVNVRTGEPAELASLNHHLLEEEARGTLVILAGPEVSARLARHISKWFKGTLFGTSAMARRLFQEAARDLDNRFVFPLPANLQALQTFSGRFRARTGRPADFTAAQAYDAMQLIGESVRNSGVNRARLGDRLRAASPWMGSAGPIAWDKTGQNTRPPKIVQLKAGRMTPFRP